MEFEFTRKVTITLEAEEIVRLRALVQNIHPNYQDNEELKRFAEELFSELGRAY